LKQEIKMDAWKLVPVAPDDNMIAKGDEQIIESTKPSAFITSESTPSDECYRAMLAVSPPPPDVIGALEKIAAGWADPGLGDCCDYERCRDAYNIASGKLDELVAEARAILAQIKGDAA